ncbi:MAG: hypothetical protein ACK514_17130 [Bacteroidota bacterium]|jgi:hypothetical protein|nr:hypothetical protein [Cytophagales bacterium]MCE2956423.1 hypothetical protein [Flammeovirgaceae bacterium]MCZ8069598.1 hypothetical protein [Cytophagales bacterium]
MKRSLIIILAIALPLCSWSQSSWQGGTEQDVLPYLTGGYYFAAWAGKNHVRGRALLAKVNKPSFIVPSGFTNNQVTAIALVADYFPKEKWRGWHLGAGVVWWQSSIQSNLRLSTVNYENVLLNGSVGYNWWFSPRFYLCPWAGLHLRVGGPSTVTVDNQSFDTPLFTPEASLKVGWCF